MPEARKIISDHFSKHILSKGIMVLKWMRMMVMMNGYGPMLPGFLPVIPPEQMRQTYAMMMQKMTADLFPSTKYQDLWFG
jgi:hypothetical protein